MRNLFSTIVIAILLVSCGRPGVKGRNGVTYNSPTEYNDYIISRQTKLIKNILNFAKASETSIDSAEHLLKESAKLTATMVEEIRNMPPYKQDSGMRDAAVQIFTFYKQVFEKDYYDILMLRKKSSEEMTAEDQAEAARIVDKISKEEEGLDKVFNEAQKKFARDNHMRLIDNSIQKEVDKLN